MDGFPSGQRGRTVNPLHICFEGSNPSPSTEQNLLSKESRFFVVQNSAGLAWMENV